MEDRVYSPPKAGPSAEAAPQTTVSGPVGLGGWLILVILGLFISPLMLIRLLAKELLPLIKDGTLEAFIDSSSPDYDPLAVSYFAYEVIGNLGLIVIGVTAFLLLLHKSKHTPRCIIGMHLFSLAFQCGAYVFASFIPAMAEELQRYGARELIGAVIGPAIWIPYFLVSKRVRNTFVR